MYSNRIGAARSRLTGLIAADELLPHDVRYRYEHRYDRRADHQIYVAEVVLEKRHIVVDAMLQEMGVSIVHVVFDYLSCDI